GGRRPGARRCRRRARPRAAGGRKVPALEPAVAAVERVVRAPHAGSTHEFLRLLVASRQVRAALLPAGVPGALDPLPPLAAWPTPLDREPLRRLLGTLSRRADKWQAAPLAAGQSRAGRGLPPDRAPPLARAPLPPPRRA